MELLQQFTTYLSLGKKSAAKATVKNYRADVSQFIKWYEDQYHEPFIPSNITTYVIESYKRSHTAWLSENKKNTKRGLSLSSIERHISSLRKFFRFLEEQELIDTNPLFPRIQTQEKDPWFIHGFKNHLYSNNIATLTIKNYIIDIKQFLDWAQQVLQTNDASRANDKDVFASLSNGLLPIYKERLIANTSLSPASINRKLSALRKYTHWLISQGKVQPTPVLSPSFSFDLHENDRERPRRVIVQAVSSNTQREQDQEEYSWFPPMRVLQKSKRCFLNSFDQVIAIPLANVINENRFFQKADESVFAPTEPTDTQQPPKKRRIAFTLENIKKEYYAPLLLGSHTFPFSKKLLYYITQTRPKWYKKYHSYAVVHYIHFAVLIAYMSGLGIFSYGSLFPETKAPQQAVLAAATNTNRLIAYQGHLSTTSDTSVNQPKKIRFGLYNDPTTAMTPLWTDEERITPDKDGNFTTVLGSSKLLPQNLFTDTPHVYLGISVDGEPELQPRQQLANVSYASNTDALQGLFPITQPGADTKNVVLALDSSGNLTIGGNANPTFQAVGGQLTLSGQTLVLTTNTGSNANVRISPDGTGYVDIQKPLQNTSESNNLSAALGAVEVDDTFAILATSSAQSALTVNQNGTGSIISATAGDIAKFTIQNNGQAYIAGNLGIGVSSPVEKLEVDGNVSLRGGQLRIGNFSQAPVALGSGSMYFDSEKKSLFYAVGGTWYPLASQALLWQEKENTLAPQNITADLLIGGNATSSAKFAFINNGVGVPTAVIRGDITLDSAGIIQTTSGRPLTIGSGSTGNILLAPASSNKIGIGTLLPLFKLDVADSPAATAAAFITNTNTSSDADVLSLKVGTPIADSNNYFVSFLNGDGDIIGKIQGNAVSSGVTYATTGSDVAEYYKKAYAAEDFTPGDLVCLSSTGGITKCIKNYQKVLIGVVSNNAGFVGGSHHDRDPKYVLVGILGQLPVKIMGTIQPGDFLTLSSIPGIAVKATKPGMVIGSMLTSTENPTIAMAAIHPTWYDPAVYLTDTSDFSITPQHNPIPDNNQLFADIFTLTNKTTNEVVTRVGALSTIIVAKLQAGTITTSHLATDSLTIAGVSIQDYIYSAVNKNTDPQLISPVGSFTVLQTDLISPLASGSGSIIVRLGEPANGASTSAALRIQNAAGTEIASISSSGDLQARNATLSGQLATTDIQTQDASVSGTLRVKKLIADQIEGLPEQKVSTSEATLAQATNSLLAELEKKFPPLAPPPAQEVIDTLGITNLTATFATISQGFVSIGPSSMTDLAVSGQLAINNTLIIGNNALNSMGTDLELQSLRQGGIRMLGGLVTIDTEGNLSVSGNATFAKNVAIKGTLATSLIRPIADSDLVIELSTTDNSAYAPQFVIKNASGSAVFAVNQQGDVSASGSAQFGKDIAAKNASFADMLAQNFRVVRNAQADTSFTQTIASASAGTATIITGEKERTIVNPLVTDHSLIYITPTSDTQGAVPYIARQTTQNPPEILGSFTIQIPIRAEKDITVNWWIIN